MSPLRRLNHDLGVHIEGRSRSIDIILRAIESGGLDRRIKLEIRGLEGIEKIEISYAKPSVELVDGIKVALAKGDDKPIRLNRARLFFSGPEDYVFSEATSY